MTPNDTHKSVPCSNIFNKLSPTAGENKYIERPSARHYTD